MAKNKEERQRIENIFEALIGIADDLKKMTNQLLKVPKQIAPVFKKFSNQQIRVAQEDLDEIRNLQKTISESATGISQSQQRFEKSINNHLINLPYKTPRLQLYLMCFCVLVSISTLIYGFGQHEKRQDEELKTYVLTEDLNQFRRYMQFVKAKAPNTHSLLVEDLNRLKRYEESESNSK